MVALAGVAWAGAAKAEVSVTVSKMHMCCPGCTKAVEKAVSTCDGVKCVANQEGKTAVLTAANVESVQKAVDAIAKAGFHGELSDKKVKFAPQKLPEGKVTRLEVTGVHNCCGACTKAIKGALAKVEGVKADSCEDKKDAFVIEGDFSAKDAIAALEKAGFHATVKAPKKA